MISQSDVERFAADGYLVVKGVFSREEMARYGDAIDAAVSRRPQHQSAMEERDAYDRMFTQFFNLWEDSPRVRALTFERRLASIASRLLGVERLRVYCDQVFLKEPGCTETGLHQDYPFLSIKETQTLNAWIPIDGSSIEAGALGYLPGSHLFGEESHVDRLMGRNLLDRPELQDAMRRPVFVELEVGSVAFHHVLTLHLSTPNRSSNTRRAFAITYFADGSTRGTSWPHASVDRSGIAVGGRIEGMATPLVWPARASLPSPPPPNPDAPRGWPARL